MFLAPKFVPGSGVNHSQIGIEGAGLRAVVRLRYSVVFKPEHYLGVGSLDLVGKLEYVCIKLSG